MSVKGYRELSLLLVDIFQLPHFPDGHNDISEFNDRRHGMREIHHWPNYQ